MEFGAGTQGCRVRIPRTSLESFKQHQQVSHNCNYDRKRTKAEYVAGISNVSTARKSFAALCYFWPGRSIWPLL